MVRGCLSRLLEVGVGVKGLQVAGQDIVAHFVVNLQQRWISTEDVLGVPAIVQLHVGDYCMSLLKLLLSVNRNSHLVSIIEQSLSSRTHNRKTIPS